MDLQKSRDDNQAAGEGELINATVQGVANMLGDLAIARGDLRWYAIKWLAPALGFTAGGAFVWTHRQCMRLLEMAQHLRARQSSEKLTAVNDTIEAAVPFVAAEPDPGKRQLFEEIILNHSERWAERGAAVQAGYAMQLLDEMPASAALVFLAIVDGLEDHPSSEKRSAPQRAVDVCDLPQVIVEEAISYLERNPVGRPELVSWVRGCGPKESRLELNPHGELLAEWIRKHPSAFDAKIEFENDWREGGQSLGRRAAVDPSPAANLLDELDESDLVLLLYCFRRNERGLSLPAGDVRAAALSRRGLLQPEGYQASGMLRWHEIKEPVWRMMIDRKNVYEEKLRDPDIRRAVDAFEAQLSFEQRSAWHV